MLGHQPRRLIRTTRPIAVCCVLAVEPATPQGRWRALSQVPQSSIAVTARPSAGTFCCECARDSQVPCRWTTTPLTAAFRPIGVAVRRASGARNHRSSPAAFAGGFVRLSPSRPTVVGSTGDSRSPPTQPAQTGAWPVWSLSFVITGYPGEPVAVYPHAQESAVKPSCPSGDSELSALPDRPGDVRYKGHLPSDTLGLDSGRPISLHREGL